MDIIRNIFNRKIMNDRLIKFDLPQNIEDKKEIIRKWKTSIDKNDLKNTNEKQLQGKFLIDFFVNILGYKDQIGNSSWNFIQEQNTNVDGTTPDGVLGFFRKNIANTKIIKDVRVVIELKDINTDLDKPQKNRPSKQTPVEQAFSYGPKFGGRWKWVIVSNFREIRLYYNNDQVNYESFFITDLLDDNNFRKFYYLLSYDNLISEDRDSKIDILYSNNTEEQKNISNNFYKDYKNIRVKLFEGIRKLNSNIDELIIFEKAQKLMDRFIFICFCEDKGLLENNIFKSVLEVAGKSFEVSDVKVWNQLKGLFQSIDKGNSSMNINRFNGGLFAEDKIMDNLIIKDEILIGLDRLADYDFDTELNVNILGHIFEHSISDIEEIKSTIKGELIEDKEGKRKKDGIFYTPEYVTNYIVEQTVGSWLENKRKELGEDKLPEIPEVPQGRRMTAIEKRTITNARKRNEEFWKSYANTLSNVKILDPACGSGAFLNSVFNYLYNEGQRVNNEIAKVANGQIYMFDLDKNILKNNLYGVDLNYESVEITKLSLWLKTANKTDPLTSLDENILCGNSLVDDANIAGDKAFDWRNSFKKVFEEGGFDIILGNPPYGAKLNDEEKKYLDSKYETTQYNYDTYKFFLELVLKLSKEDAYIGLITPNTYFVLEKSDKLRKYLFDNFTLLNLVELFDVFPDAIVEPIISIYKKTKPILSQKFEVISVPRKIELDSNFLNFGIRTNFEQKDLKKKEGYLFNYKQTSLERDLCNKIYSISQPLSKYINVTTGIKPYQAGKGTPKQTKETVKEKPFTGFQKLDDTWKPLVRGESINKYIDLWDGEYIKYGEWLAEPRKSEMFFNEKIFIRQTSDTLIANYDNTGKVGKNTIHCIYHKPEQPNINLKYILGLINSKLLNWIFQHENFHIVGKPLAETKVIYVNRLPIIIDDNIEPYVEKVDFLLKGHKLLHDKAKIFINYIVEIYKPKKVSEKLLGFHNLEFGEFFEELKKQKVRINEQQKFDLFNLYKEKVKELKDIKRKTKEINTTLDKMVYRLYQLTEEEIKMIERDK